MIGSKLSTPADQGAEAPAGDAPGSYEADRRVAELIATVSRELGTPLAMVLGFAKMLATSDCSPEQVRDMAGEIERATKRMARHMRDLLDSAGSVGQPSPVGATVRSSELERLHERLAAAEQRKLALEDALVDAQTSRQQLQSYADDFRRTFAESRHLLQQMTVLYEVSTAIGATVDPDEVVARTVEGLGRLLPHASAAVYLLEEDQQLARRQAARDPDGTPDFPDVALSDGTPLGRCLATGAAVLESQCAPDEPTPRAAWTLALPLAAGSQRLGALLLARHGDRPFTEEEQHLVEMVASQSAMALQNARLAATDGLTGLYNRRHFEQVLAYECDRARRAGRPLGLLMMDVDHFKRFNESFGHPAGDEVLRLVASTLASELRRTDIVARVGGEEFAAILPEDNRDEVAVAAERLRRAVEQRPPLVFEEHELPGVRISVGGASLDPQTVTPHGLMKAADTALRRAKRQGRNRSVVADGTGGREDA